VGDGFRAYDDKRRANGLWQDHALEFIKFKDMEARLAGKPLLKGYLEREQVSLIVGEYSCGKTFFALDRDLHIAAGCDWFDCRVNGGPVVYLATEAGRSIQNRVAAWRQEHGFDHTDLPFAAITTPVDLCHADAGDVERVIECIKCTSFVDQNAGGLALLEIDTVNRSMAGGNENAPDDMGGYISSIDRLRDRLGCHISNIHHFGKDAGRGSRGHSSLISAVDCEVQVMNSVATITKQRDGVTGKTFPFKLRQVTLGQDEDGDPVTSCIVEQTSSEAPKKHRKPLTGSAKLGLAQLYIAVDKNVTATPACDQVPNGARGCEIELFKKYLRLVGLINPDGNEREQYKRMYVTLAEHGYAIAWGEHIWALR
jgi:hypothetical protein